MREYILLLPIKEQISEINRMIKYHTNSKQPYVDVKSKYALINQFKDLKKSAIRCYLEDLGDNPSIAKYSPPLHKMIHRM